MAAFRADKLGDFLFLYLTQKAKKELNLTFQAGQYISQTWSCTESGFITG